MNSERGQRSTKTNSVGSSGGRSQHRHERQAGALSGMEPRPAFKGAIGRQPEGTGNGEAQLFSAG
jgi:hypothetical protein